MEKEKVIKETKNIKIIECDDRTIINDIDGNEIISYNMKLISVPDLCHNTKYEKPVVKVKETKDIILVFNASKNGTPHIKTTLIDNCGNTLIPLVDGEIRYRSCNIYAYITKSNCMVIHNFKYNTISKVFNAESACLAQGDFIIVKKLTGTSVVVNTTGAKYKRVKISNYIHDSSSQYTRFYKTEDNKHKLYREPICCLLDLQSGKEVKLPRKYSIITNMHNGMFLTRDYESGKWGALNEQYEEVIPPTFDVKPTSFNKFGFSIVSNDTECTIIDNKNNIIFEKKLTDEIND